MGFAEEGSTLQPLGGTFKLQNLRWLTAPKRYQKTSPLEFQTLPQWYQHVPSMELTYPTCGTGKTSTQKCQKRIRDM